MAPLTSPEPTRRAVATAAAWTVPAVVVAVAAPLAAASGPAPAPIPVPGEPETYPDATYSGTTQVPSNPSLKSTGSVGYIRTTFTAVTDDKEYSSYKAGWTYVVTSAAPLTGITFDGTSLVANQQGVVVDGLYTYSWILTRAAEATWVRLKPTTYPQIIQFILYDTAVVPAIVVGEATATTLP